MKEAERKRKILYHQHLTSRCDAQTAARDVLALQAQFLRHAQMSLRLDVYKRQSIRCAD